MSVAKKKCQLNDLSHNEVNVQHQSKLKSERPATGAMSFNFINISNINHKNMALYYTFKLSDESVYEKIFFVGLIKNQ